MFAFNPIQPITDACEWILTFWHDLIGNFEGSWGWSIILLTFTIRIAILPLTFKGVKSMQRLQSLQPEIKSIQARYKDDKQRQQQEIMAFYQREKVNPLGSCLPLILQIPFFIALFQLLRSPEFKADIADNPGFGPIENLADKVTEPWLLGVLIVLYVGTQLAASAVTAMSADPTQRRIMFALPFVFVIFIVNFEAGLIVYWITTNVWTIGQQLLVKKLYPKPVPGSARGGGGTGPGAREAAGPGAGGNRRAHRRPGEDRRRREATEKKERREKKEKAAAPAARRQRRAGQAASVAAQEEEALRSQAMNDDPREDDLFAEGEGDSLGEAKWAAMKELEPRFPGVTAECVKFEVIDDPGPDGTARVRAEVDEDAWRDAAEIIPEEPTERVRAIVGRIVHAIGLRATLDIDESEDEIRATVNGDDLGLLIGKHGTTIDAVQHIAFRAAFRGREERKPVTVDAAGYRERREAALHRTADRAAAEALRYERAVELEPMRAPERKIVHTYLSERTDVETHSEGDEPDRRLVVSPAQVFRPE